MKKLKTGVDKKIENVIKEDIFFNILTVVSMILFIISLMIFAKYLQHYMEHTGCYYHLDYVLVKRYHRKDYKMTYEELEKYITKRKIIVRNGRLELPYKYGRIPLYTCGEPVSAGLFRCINKKCHTKLDIGLFIIAVGLILKVIFYFPAHREFKNCRKFVKVR